MTLASQSGLEGLTIGSLAEATGLSKSGLFAHFGSREDLQLAVLDWVREKFAENVFRAVRVELEAPASYFPADRTLSADAVTLHNQYLRVAVTVRSPEFAQHFNSAQYLLSMFGDSERAMPLRSSVP